MFKKTQVKTLLASVLIGSMAAVSTPAMANNEAMMDLLKVLRDKGSISAAEYEVLANAAKADKEQTEAMKADVEKKVDSLPKITTKGKLKFEDDNGNEFRIGGRLQADTTVGLGDVNFAGEGGNPVTEFRRARMYLSGKFADVWKFKFQYDFADQAAQAPTGGIRDAYIAYTGFKPVTVSVGHQKMPLSLEELTSSKYITFIERSQLVNGIAADVGGGRQYGVVASSYFNDMFTASGGYYIGTANEDEAPTGTGFVGRLTFSPIHEKDRMVHLGLGFAMDEISGGGGFNIDGEPEIHPGADILENEAADYESSQTFIVEAAGIYGPWALQAEYAMNELEDSNSGLANIDADAWYVYGSYYFTGESRNYKWKKGSYSQTKVKNPMSKGGYGAWEAALRYTSGDFENAGAGPVVSSEADIMTLGLNWYPENNVRFSLNYVQVLDSNAAADAELATELDAGSTADDASYLIGRAQWYF
ncbi:MAG: porin [Gammaproteobacteria bacterium]